MSSSDDVVLELRDIHKSFGEVDVLKGVSLAVRRGSVATIIGPSGGGKSTLLRCANMLEVPSSGEVFMEGEPVRPAVSRLPWEAARLETKLARVRARMPMVFQRFHLFTHRNARDNIVEAQRQVLGRGRAEAERRALELLERVGMADRAHAYPTQLSGGEQQRVAIARALAMDPEVILFDEPTSSLDPERVGEVLEIIQALAKDGLTMVIVTHEMAFARMISDTVYFMDRGSILDSGPPEKIFGSTANPRARSFVAGLSS